MSTNDNNNDNITTSKSDKIDYTINFDPNACAVKPIEEHHLYHLAKEMDREQLPEDRKKNMLTGMAETTMDDESFFRKNISPRRAILGSWFREGSLGFIFGRRGAGKTWFAWDMAISQQGRRLRSMEVRNAPEDSLRRR
jgi:hypothetical protein